MTAKRDLKRRVRERQTRTGETYTTARRHVLAARDESAADDPEETNPGVATGEATPSDEKAAKAPIDVDEAVDFTRAAAELGMKCQVLMFPKLAERADPARVLAAVRDALTATQNDPGTEMLRKLVFRGEAPRGLVMLTREPRFRQHVEAGFTGVSSDGRVLAIHVAGHQGIVTALGTIWRNTSTFVLMAPDDFVTKLVMPPGTIQELGARYGVSIPAGPIAPLPHTSPGSLRGITTRPSATSSVPTVFLIFKGRRYPITRKLFVIGRNHASDLQIKDGHISRKHAAVSWQNGAHYLVDLDSQAGIEYRGLKIRNKRIEEGDVFSLGEYVLRFTYLDTDG